jgi:hypothetical protein
MAHELSTVINPAHPDVKIEGVAQNGSKEGSVGHPSRRGHPGG